MTGETNRSTLLASLSPQLDNQEYIFATVAHAELGKISRWVGLFHENEGITVICSLEQATSLNLQHGAPFRKITLDVHSSLNAIGLTASVSNALTQASIPCNVVAGYFHDHLFVPSHQADAAMTALIQLSEQAQASI